MADLAPGDILDGKHRIDAKLGEGGFGIVFRATTLATNRTVAVKLLKRARGATADVQVERFMRELRAIANLRSEYTVTLFDYGRTESGHPFMVTEFVAGEDLAKLLRTRGPLPHDVAVQLLMHALDSLAEAHGVGIIHRDIKPQNLRVADPFGPAMRLKVLDFGLAKSMDDEEVGLTGAGHVIGTPRYMSPEQLAGKPLAPPSDIYSLGLVAYEMLVGPNSTAMKERMPGGPLHISVAEPVPDELREIVNRMLSTDPEGRFQTASEVLSALRPIRRALQALADDAPTARRENPVGAPEDSATTETDTAVDPNPPILLAAPPAPGPAAAPDLPPAPQPGRNAARPDGAVEHPATKGVRKLIGVLSLILAGQLVVLALSPRHAPDAVSAPPTAAVVEIAPSPKAQAADEAAALAIAEGRGALRRGEPAEAIARFHAGARHGDTRAASELRESGHLEDALDRLIAEPTSEESTAVLEWAWDLYASDPVTGPWFAERHADERGQRAATAVDSAARLQAIQP